VKRPRSIHVFDCFSLTTIDTIGFQPFIAILQGEIFAMQKRFEGKVAVVTGASSGIGKVTAQIFASEGASVVVTNDKNVKGGEETVRQIKDAGGEAIFVQCDVSEENEVEAMVQKCVEVYGRLDLAFNNAGIGPDGANYPIAPVSEYPGDAWRRMVEINLIGVFHCLKYEIRQMLKQKSGAIVNNASVGACRCNYGFSPYNASKSGLIFLTQAAAIENAAHGIRINTILPGPVGRTSLMENLSDTADRPDFENLVPLKRISQPEEIAEAVMWLCSDAASFITGIAMPIDGGLAIKPAF
jgi:NAD(P)-dependent dehydrogenase (short-subunit alcohol dehydrogenase family)